MYQTEPNGNWSEWGILGPVINGPPAVFHNLLILVIA
jgi:hypothetical protein